MIHKKPMLSLSSNLILILLAACTSERSTSQDVDAGADAKVFTDAMEPPALPTSGNYFVEWSVASDTCTEGPQGNTDTGRVIVASTTTYSIAWAGHGTIMDSCMSNSFSDTCSSPTIHYTGMPGGAPISIVVHAAGTWQTYHTWTDTLEEDVSCVGGGCSTSCGQGQVNCQFPCKRTFTRSAMWAGP